MKVATERVGGWDDLTPAAKGDNAWLFVNEEVSPALPCPARARCSVEPARCLREAGGRRGAARDRARWRTRGPLPRSAPRRWRCRSPPLVLAQSTTAHPPAPFACQVIAESIKAYVDFEKKLLEGVPKDERATARPIDVSGGAMDGKALDYAAVKRLKDLPTKQELYATIARLLNQVRAAGRRESRG